MTELTPEQMEEFVKWETEHAGEPHVTPDVIKKVINDDVEESQESEAKREHWDRNYNHTPEKIEKRFVGDDEKK